MPLLQGHLPTPEASRFMNRLCYHFGRHIEVSCDEHQGRAHFPWGQCQLTVEGEAIELEIQAIDADQMAQVREVIDEHVSLFSRKTLAVHWSAGVEAGSVPKN